jgi:DNA processing protein
LTFKGNIDLINKNIIAIVGTRNASFNGLKFAEKISYEIGLNNIITVSGLARGIDTAAHKASLNSGTIGVIAGGIDNIYPKENANLYEEIINKGLLISENPLGTAPRSVNFPRRNRIISGLALGLVVVEATLRSGTLISARFALEQNREVFAVPGSPFDPRYEGTNNLIKQGAKLTQNSEDVLEEITKLSEYKTNVEASVSDLSSNLLLESPIIYDNLRATKTTSNSSGNIFDSKKDAPKKELFNNQKTQNIEKLILSKINYTPISIEILINELEISAKTANEVLLELELMDKIINENGKISLKS